MPKFEVLAFFLGTIVYWLMCVIWIKNSKNIRIFIPPFLILTISQTMGHYSAQGLDPFFIIAALFTVFYSGALVMALELLKSFIPNIFFEKLTTYKLWTSSILMVLLFFSMLPAFQAVAKKIEDRKFPEVAAAKAAIIAKKAAEKAAFDVLAYKLRDKSNIEHRTEFHDFYEYYEITISVAASDFARVLVYQKSAEIICVEYFHLKPLGHYNRDFTQACHDDIQFRW